MYIATTRHLEIYQRTMKVWQRNRMDADDIMFSFSYVHAQCYTLANVITDVADIDDMFLVAELGDMLVNPGTPPSTIIQPKSFK